MNTSDKEIQVKEPVELDLNRGDWKLVRFGDVAIKQNTSVDRENTDLTRYVAGQHMRSEDLHLREWGEVGEDYLGPAFTRKFETGEILYGSRRTYLRKVVVAPFDGITANTTFVIKPNEDVILKELLPFVMLSEGFAQHSIRNSKGSVNPYINWKDIANYEFLLPPKDQQAKLAELLWAADALHEYQHNLIDTFDDFIKASLKHEYKTHQGPFQKLGSAGAWKSGGTPSRSNPAYWGGDIPWVSPKDMKMEKINNSIEKITQTAIESRISTLPPNSILVVVRGLILNHSFPVGITAKEVTFNQDIKALIASEKFNPFYILYFLQFMKEVVLGLTTTTTHGTKRLASDALFNLDIPAPPIQDQLKFINEIQKIKESLDHAKENRSTNLKLLKSLINQIF
jgi:restriction endonuclease S subunit